MYDGTLESAPWYPMAGFPPFPALYYSSLFHSFRSGCATHQDHLAIHIGPVLLITRLELRDENRDDGNSGDVPCASEKKIGARRNVYI